MILEYNIFDQSRDFTSGRLPSLTLSNAIALQMTGVHGPSSKESHRRVHMIKIESPNYGCEINRCFAIYAAFPRFFFILVLKYYTHRIMC